MAPSDILMRSTPSVKQEPSGTRGVVLKFADDGDPISKDAGTDVSELSIPLPGQSLRR